MLLNYLKLSLRLMARNPFFTAINVFGLSVGFAVFLTLWQYSRNELKSDQFHEGFERIVRIGVNWRWKENGNEFMNVSGSIAPEKTFRISQDFPEVESYLRIIRQPQFIEELVGHENSLMLSYDKKNISFKEANGCYADANLFEFFWLPLHKGDKSKVLKEGNSIVLSTRTATKYFGNENPVGKLLVLNGTRTLKVTGVYENLPVNTHLDFDFVISNALWKNKWDNYIWFAGTHYLKLKEGASIEETDHKIRKQSDHYWAINFNNQPSGLGIAEMFLQPLAEVAFSKGFYMDFFSSKSKPALVVLSLASVLVLAMAWINYVNLTLAHHAKRMKEWGVRKTSGARTRDLIWQISLESCVVSILSFALAITFLQLFAKPLETLLHIQLTQWKEISYLAGVTFTTVVVVNIFFMSIPLSFLNRKRPVRLLNGNSKFDSNHATTMLTALQYTIAIGLISYSLLVALQLDFIFGKTIGSGADRVVIIESPIARSASFNRELDYFKNQLLVKGIAKDVTFSNTLPGDGLTTTNMLFVKRVNNVTNIGMDSNGGVDENFIPFFQFRLIAGRNFKTDDRANAIILSRIGTQRLGYVNPEDAVGDKVLIDFNADWKWFEVEVIGVIEDYRLTPYSGFRAEGSNGICLTYKDFLFPKFSSEKIAVILNKKNYSKTVQAMEKLFSAYFPGNAFNFYFLEDHFNRHYTPDRIARNQVMFFTFIAIGIACVGSLGMISKKATDKVKEIGIRKVLGAEFHQMMQLLLSATFKQILVATTIGIPTAYFLAHQYLQKFAERIELHWWYFALPVSILAFLLLTTVLAVVLKAVKTNPVEALKHE